MSEDESVTVTIVSQVFYPDTSANAGVLTGLATGLAGRGVDVRVLTTQPFYTAEDRETTAPSSKTHRGVSIRRVPATRFDRNAGVAWRMTNEVTFFLAALTYLVLARLRGRDPGVLVLPTAPTFLPVLGWPLSPLYGSRYVPVVMDLYPDMAVQLGFLSEGGIVFRAWDWLNRRTYQTAVRIVTIGETMEDTLVSKYGTDCDVTVIHNWADGDRIQPQPKSENAFALEHGFLDELTVLYSGNLGRHHDLESLVEAATVLEPMELDPPPHFVLIGEGGKKPVLQRMVADEDLDTVTFLPYQPVEVLPDSLTSGDVAVVTMEEGVEGLCVSSKFYTALASGQAILAISSRDAEIGSVVERTGCGIRIDPNSPEQIVDALQHWVENPETVHEMGKKARAVFEDEFSRDGAIEAYRRVFEEVSPR